MGQSELANLIGLLFFAVVPALIQPIFKSTSKFVSALFKSKLLISIQNVVLVLLRWQCVIPSPKYNDSVLLSVIMITDVSSEGSSSAERPLVRV